MEDIHLHIHHAIMTSYYIAAGIRQDVQDYIS